MQVWAEFTKYLIGAAVFQTIFLSTVLLEGKSHAASKAWKLVGWSDNAI